MSLPSSPNYDEYNPDTGITSDGVYAFAAPFTGSEYVVYVDGTFGGGTATYGYIDLDGTFTSFKNSSGGAITTTTNHGMIVTAPPSKILGVELLGSAAASLKITHILHNR